MVTVNLSEEEAQKLSELLAGAMEDQRTSECGDDELAELYGNMFDKVNRAMDA